MTIKHVFFDLDHTLWDFEANAEKAYEVCFSKNNLDLNVQKFMEIDRPINHAYWKKYREEEIDKEQLQYGRLYDAFHVLDFLIDDKTINQIAIDFLFYLPTFNQLFDGTVELLQYLKPKYQLHIITNGFNEVQIPKMKNSKIIDYFDQIITAESVGVRKPNPKIFHYALAQANAKASESMMIGDSYEADIEGAKQLGMHTIHFRLPDNQILIKKYEVSHLNQIKNYL